MSHEDVRVGFDGKFETKSIELAPGDPAPYDPSRKFRLLGTRVPRLDAPAKVTGQARYSIDVRLPGMLFGRILRSPYAAAIVRELDLSGARKHPGVRAVYAIVEPGTKVRFAGQEIAAVAADSDDAAADALGSIRVRYEPTPFVVELEAARKADAPRVLEGGTRKVVGDPYAKENEPAGAGTGNVRGPRTFEKGNIEEGLRRSEAVVVGTYVTQVQTHAALETHGMVARWDRDELTVWSSTQGIFGVRDALAEELRVPVSKIRVITEYMGGGFGAKFGARAEGIAAARLARLSGAPVKVFLDRKEEHLATGNRPSSHQWIRAGATKDGKLTALQLVVHGSGGVNGGTGTSGPLKNIYACDNVKTEEFDVFTNAGPSSAMRAPGHPQGAFALEATLDELGKRLGIDPLEIRLRNDPSQVRREQFRIGAERIGWKQRDARRQGRDPWIRRGVGLGAAVWYNTGHTGSKATVTIHRDGSVEVVHGVQDIGTGSRTMVAIVAAEELGLPLNRVSVRMGDTRLPMGPASGGSGTTPSSAPTVRAAAYQAHRKVAAHIARHWKIEASDVDFADGTFSSRSNPSKKAPWTDACGLLPEEGASATSERAENHDDAWKRFTGGAQFAEVEVDVETGQVRVTRVVAVHDCGLVINALTTESQIQGGVLQGISYALYENRVLDRQTGRMVNPNLEQYKILGAKDTPEIEVIVLPVYDGVNNTHSVGIGEPSTVPTAAAIANAVSHAVGARIRRLPITPEVVLEAVDEAARGDRS